MCGYNPFYWYEKDLDNEYLERTGNSMDGFKQAQQEWERDCIYFPFDRYDTDYREDYEDEDPEVDRRLEDREW